MSFNSEFHQKVEDRIDFLKQNYGRRQVKTDFFSYIESVVTKHINRKEIEERNTNTNGGIPWIKFRKMYFNEVYMRDQGRCVYCTERVARRESTLDHVVPPLRGGKNELSNIVLSCGWCNQDKGILTAEEYYYKQLKNAADGIVPGQSDSGSS